MEEFEPQLRKMTARISQLEERVEKLKAAQTLAEGQQKKDAGGLLEELCAVREEGAKRHEKIKRFLRNCVLCSEIKQYTAFIETKLDALRAAPSHTQTRSNYSAAQSYRRETKREKQAKTAFQPRGNDTIRVECPLKTKSKETICNTSAEKEEKSRMTKGLFLKKRNLTPPSIECDLQHGRKSDNEIEEQRPTLFHKETFRADAANENLISDIIALSNFNEEAISTSSCPGKQSARGKPERLRPSSAEGREESSEKKQRPLSKKREKFGELMRTVHGSGKAETGRRKPETVSLLSSREDIEPAAMAYQLKTEPREKTNSPAKTKCEAQRTRDTVQNADSPPEKVQVSCVVRETFPMMEDGESERMFFSMMADPRSQTRKGLRIKRLRRTQSTAGEMNFLEAKIITPSLNFEATLPSMVDNSSSHNKLGEEKEEDCDVVDYILDEEGFLCNTSGQRILDDRGQHVKLEPEHVQYLKATQDVSEIFFEE